MKKLIIILAMACMLISCASIPAREGKIANWKDMKAEGRIPSMKRLMIDGARFGTGFHPSRDIMVHHGIYPNTITPFVMPFP